jgi:hypothetical protein
VPTTATGGGGALAATARIVGGVIADCARGAEAATALSEQVTVQTERMVAVLGGGPPHDVQESVRRSQAARERLEQAGAALLECAEALRAFLVNRT